MKPAILTPILLLVFGAIASLPAADALKPAGASGKIGTLSNPKVVSRLEIKKYTRHN